METHKPKTIEEAIEMFQQFLECDLYSKFRPEKIIKGKLWVRDDSFKDIIDFHKYMENHFGILFKQIKNLKNSNSQDSEMPEEAVEGLISAMKDVKAGRYRILESGAESIKSERKFICNCGKKGVHTCSKIKEVNKK